MLYGRHYDSRESKNSEPGGCYENGGVTEERAEADRYQPSCPTVPLSSALYLELSVVSNAVWLHFEELLNVRESKI